MSLVFALRLGDLEKAGCGWTLGHVSGEGPVLTWLEVFWTFFEPVYIIMGMGSTPGSFKGGSSLVNEEPQQISAVCGYVVNKKGDLLDSSGIGHKTTAFAGVLTIASQID